MKKYQGQDVKVLGGRDGMAHIELPNGQQRWVHPDELE